MGKRGPKPKPTLVKVLEGNPSRRPISDLEPIPTMPLVKPAYVEMDELASQEWDRVVNAMPPGIYAATDTGVLTAYALAFSMMIKAQAEIDANGVIFTTYLRDEETGNQLVHTSEVNPAVKVWKTASETLLKTADRLGLHPGARVRLEVPKRGAEPEQKQSRFAGLLG